MQSAYEQNLTKELLDLQHYLEQENQSKVLSAIRQVFRILETQPASIELESIVSAYLSLLSHFIRTNVEALYSGTPRMPFLQFLSEQSALALKTLASKNQNEGSETLSHFYTSIPIFLKYLNEHSFIESNKYYVGSSMYYPEQGRIKRMNSEEIFLPKLQNLLFRTLLLHKNEVLPKAIFTDGYNPLFSSEETFHTTLSRLRKAIRPLEEEMKIITHRGNGIYLDLSETAEHYSTRTSLMRR